MMNKEEIIRNMTLSNVLHVYSGKPGCACGCRGSHRYSSKSGYDTQGGQIGDGQVTKVMNVLKAHEAECVLEDEGSIVFYDAGSRWYIAYLVD